LKLPVHRTGLPGDEISFILRPLATPASRGFRCTCRSIFLVDEEEIEMEKKEKPLEKMTAKELREVALGLPGIHGVHAMKKEELLVAIRKAKGIPEPEKEKKVGVKKEKVILTVAQLKQKMKELKVKREEILQQKNFKMAQILRKRINRLKKMTRRVA
jgi:protein-arginine kinase activator protein McsA